VKRSELIRQLAQQGCALHQFLAIMKLTMIWPSTSKSFLGLSHKPTPNKGIELTAASVK
jgi:hypothetical protein